VEKEWNFMKTLIFFSLLVFLPIQTKSVDAQTFEKFYSNKLNTSPLTYQSPSQKYCAPYYQYSLPTSDTVCKDSNGKNIPVSDIYLCKLGTMTCPPNTAPVRLNISLIPDYFTCSQIKTEDSITYHQAEECHPEDPLCNVSKLNFSYNNSLQLLCPNGLQAVAGNLDILGNIVFYYCLTPGDFSRDGFNEKACEGTEVKGVIHGTSTDKAYCCKRPTTNYYYEYPYEYPWVPR
jgi:hypothetical protein